MKPRQPSIDAAKTPPDVERVPTPADVFWKMRES
jgi:hypothetical protein